MGTLPFLFNGHNAPAVQWAQCPCCCSIGMMPRFNVDLIALVLVSFLLFTCSMFIHGCAIQITFVLPCKLTTFSPHTEAASLDIAKAYRNSPILPSHKIYLCMYWKNNVYVQHVLIEGLATAGGIQSTIAD